MQDEIFFLLKDPEDDCLDVIRMRSSDLRIRIWCLTNANYTEPNDKLVFYADNDGELLAFESTDNQHNIYKMLDAIRWYAQYIGNSGMAILSHDPRVTL